VTQPNNQIKGWKYYNHAAIPTCAPHEEPNLIPIEEGFVWCIDGKTPLMVRYTTDWDCGYDTGWWYLIKEGPFELEALSSNSRKHIKRALKKNKVEKIIATDFVDALYECSHQAFLKYKLASNEDSFETFKKGCDHASKNGVDYWASFDVISGQMTGFITVKEHDDWTDIITAKFDPNYLKLQASDALYAHVLDYYLNYRNKKYVSSGSRSISHVSNTQEYKEQHFGYRKVYCKLHLKYSKKMHVVIKLLYPFRNLINRIGKIVKKVHLVSSVLKMEEIARLGAK